MAEMTLDELIAHYSGVSGLRYESTLAALQRLRAIEERAANSQWIDQQYPIPAPYVFVEEIRGVQRVAEHVKARDERGSEMHSSADCVEVAIELQRLRALPAEMERADDAFKKAWARWCQFGPQDTPNSVIGAVFKDRDVAHAKARIALEEENKRLRSTLRTMMLDAETLMEGAGMPEFQQFESLALLARAALAEVSKKP
jgi:hypothetical protein